MFQGPGVWVIGEGGRVELILKCLMSGLVSKEKLESEISQLFADVELSHPSNKTLVSCDDNLGLCSGHPSFLVIGVKPKVMRAGEVITDDILMG